MTPPSEEPHPQLSYNGLYDQPPTLKLGGRIPQLTSPFETPPTSPRSPSHNPYFPSLPTSDSGFGGRRPSSTYSTDNDVCNNCQIVVPKKVSAKLPDGAPGSPAKDGRGRNGSPVLRTSHNFPVRGSGVCDDLSSSTSSDTSDTEQSKSFDSNGSQMFPDSVPASPMYSRGMHTHTLSYVSTSQPQSPESYSLLRRTCLRTLSTERLPMGKAAGPVFFGDSYAGYTIAYMFRLRDPRARGAMREYALIAMAGRDGLRATKAMVKITEVFEQIANRIVALADKVLERDSQNALPSRPTTALPVTTPPLGTSASSMPVFQTSPQKDRPLSVASSPATRNITPVSSFLSAKKVDPDGYPRISSEVMKAKNLVEIVGQEDFFVWLHGIFCGLLHSLINQYGQLPTA